MKNKKLLISLLETQSSISNDNEINSFIEKTIGSINGVSVEKDSFGNIYATKGEGKNGYKCIVSHTDTVHKIYDKRKVFEYENTLFSVAVMEDKTAYRESRISQVGVGGDDKVGVYMCIQSLIDFNDIKAVFFRFEESGCRGSKDCNMSFFDDCNFVLQSDRRGSSDFITYTNGVECASSKFREDMLAIGDKYNYSLKGGVATDVGALKNNGLKISAANISSGYHDPHSSSEKVNIDEVANCYSFISEIFTVNGNTRYDHEKIKYIQTIIPYNSSFRYGKKKIKKNKDYLKNGFFSSMTAISSRIEVDYEEDYTLFTRIANSDYFKITMDEYCDIKVKSCPVCDYEGELMYISYDNQVICRNKQHTECINFDHVAKLVELEDAGDIFVYNRANDAWILKNKSVWSEELISYELKK